MNSFPTPDPSMSDSTHTASPSVSDAPLEWTRDDPELFVPEWESLGRARLRPEQASRHFLILGETGSGKTRSAVLPLAGAALRYRGPQDSGSAPLAPSMLVIDPKGEVGPELEQANRREKLGRRIVHLALGGAWTLHAFETGDPQQMHGGEIAGRILSFAEGFQIEKRDTRQPFFAQAVEGLLTELVGVDLFLFRTGGVPRVRAFWTTVGHGVAGQLGGASLGYTPENYPGVHARLCNLAAQKRAVLKTYLETCRTFGVPADATLQVATWPTVAEETWTSVVATLNNVLREVASEALARHLSLNPFEPPPAERQFRVADAMDEGACVAYRPTSTSAVGTTIGRALKTAFFEQVFVRREKRRAFVYVADEFQRFVTADPVSGEQSFLDRCRAYRAVCVLATQSVASLRYALAQSTGGGSEGSEAALEIMLQNCGTKLFFRSTDTATQVRLEKLLPAAPVHGRPHVAQVRPASTLRVGESYALMSDGGWQRRTARIGPRRPAARGPTKGKQAKTTTPTPKVQADSRGHGRGGQGSE